MVVSETRDQISPNFFIHIAAKMTWLIKAALSVTFDLLILETIFLFFKNTVKN